MVKPTIESVAKVLVVNENREALILTVGEYKARPDKSFKPDLPGGLVDPDETELVAVGRELQEETGIVVDPANFELGYAKTEFYFSENKSITKFVYLVKLNKTPEVTISWEHSSYDWVSLDGLLESIELRPFYKEALEYCFSAHLL